MERGWERTRGRGELMRAGRVSSSSSRFPCSWASPLAGERAPSMNWAALGLGSSPDPSQAAQPSLDLGKVPPGSQGRPTPWGGWSSSRDHPLGQPQILVLGHCTAAGRDPKLLVLATSPMALLLEGVKAAGSALPIPVTVLRGGSALLPGVPSGREMAPANAQKPALIWPSFNPCRKEKNQAAAPAGAGSGGVWARPGRTLGSWQLRALQQCPRPPRSLGCSCWEKGEGQGQTRHWSQ